jgi:probable rRNA maturation factor
VNRRLLQQLARELLNIHFQRRHFELCLHLVSPAEIERINRSCLQHAGPTDVITFDYHDHTEPESLNGEMFICLEVASANARRFHTTWQSELTRYLVHGLLHLHGFDDREPVKRRRMKSRESRLLKQLAARFPLSQLGRRARVGP